MTRTLALVMLVAGLSGCVTANTDQTPVIVDAPDATAATDASRLVVSTATVDGRAYDVVYDRYAPEMASIYGVRVMDGGFLPRAEIIERATPCRLGGMTIISATGLEHPTRDDLEFLDSFSIDCSETGI